MSAHGPRGRREDGAAAVEFALVAPVLILLVFGIVSFGFMLSFRQAMSQATAEGSRAAAVAPASFTDAQVEGVAREAVNDALESYGVSCQGASLVRDTATAGSCSVVTASCSHQSSRSCVTVTLGYDYRDHSPIPNVPGVSLLMPATLGYSSTTQVS